MSRIRGKDTKPEVRVRSALHRMGYRFRLHSRNLPGKPDIVLPKHATVVFVHGCFWHRHEDCRYTTTPSTRPEFWQAKFEANVRRDAAIQKDLIKAGWRVATVWECALRETKQVALTAEYLAVWLPSDSVQIEFAEKDIQHSE